MRLQLIYLLVLIVLLSCEKSYNQSKADDFMSKVVSDSYDEMFLPDLEPGDIDALLEYRNDKTILDKYPANPISSFIGDSITVGIIALWTIESIRITELTGDDSAFERFPSLNPMIRDTVNQHIGNFALQDSVSKKYYEWWNNSALGQKERMKINPLDGTNLIWN